MILHLPARGSEAHVISITGIKLDKNTINYEQYNTKFVGLGIGGWARGLLGNDRAG